MKESFDVAPCGYFSFFDDGTLHIVNETLCHLLGYKKNELEGKNIETIFTIPTRIFYQTHFFPLVKMHGHAEEIFITLLTKEKEQLPVLLNAKREKEGAKLYTSCGFIVVANRKKFEDELVAARNAAEKALKENSELIQARAALQQHAEELDENMQIVKKQNHELKQFNHVVTHSLREPLRKILLYSEKLVNNNLPTAIKTDLQKLSNASGQMRNIVSGLQEYIWLSDVFSEFTSIDLDELVKELEEKLKKEFGGLLLLKTEPLGKLEGDKKQLELLFYHILTNAIKFKKHRHAEVFISASIIKQNTFKAVENKYKYDDFIKLEIMDKGIGFDPAFKEEAFGLFKKFHHEQGSGLGLALCKKIVENHFGFISANTNVDEGTNIMIVLPLRQSK
jgi:sigma-B regulation protein RsbU (phosphoserine phosphatase)